jgi:hypothetical protein
MGHLNKRSSLACLVISLSACAQIPTERDATPKPNGGSPRCSLTETFGGDPISTATSEGFGGAICPQLRLRKSGAIGSIREVRRTGQMEEI